MEKLNIVVNTDERDCLIAKIGELAPSLIPYKGVIEEHFGSDWQGVSDLYTMLTGNINYDLQCYQVMADSDFEKICEEIKEEYSDYTDDTEFELELLPFFIKSAIDLASDVLNETDKTKIIYIDDEPICFGLNFIYQIEDEAYEPVPVDTSVEVDQWKEYFSQKKYFQKLDDNEEILKRVFELSDLLDDDFEDFKSTLKRNFSTKGKASRNILEDGGNIDRILEYVDAGMTDADLKEDIEESEGLAYELSSLDKICYAMDVASERHSGTDYDSIDKSGMSDDQVSALRRSHNSA